MALARAPDLGARRSRSDAPLSACRRSVRRDRRGDRLAAGAPREGGREVRGARREDRADAQRATGPRRPRRGCARSPRATARATSCGLRVPTPGGSLHVGVGEHARVADEARADAPRRRRRCRAGRPAARARTRAGRTSSRCRCVDCRRGRLARQRGDEQQMAAPRSSIPGGSARASTIGARRLTSSARSICSR